MNKIKIFYTKSGEEIKDSLERYFKFVKGQSLDDSCFWKIPEKEDEFNKLKESYFYKFYPAKFSGYQLYFIFDEDLSAFKSKSENKLSPTGFMISMIVDLFLSKKEYNYDIYVNGVVNQNIIKTDIEDYKYFGEFNLDISSEKGYVPNFVKIKEITQFKDIGFITKIVAHPHPGKKPSIEKLAIPKKKADSKGENITQKDEKQLKLNRFFDLCKDEKALIKESAFILVIDDVLGDYTKTFLPFYTLIKYNVEGKNIIMRGIKDPTEYGEILKIFPADLILVDISFEKLKEIREKYFWAAEVDVGIQLYNAIFSQLQSGGFSKKMTPHVKIFTSFKRKNDELKEIWIQKDEIEKLLKWLEKFNLKQEIERYCGSNSENYFIIEYQEGVPREVFYKLIYLKKYFNKSAKWLELISDIPVGEEKTKSEERLIESHDKFLTSIIDEIMKKKIDITEVEIYKGTEDLTDGKPNGKKPIFPEENE